MSRRIVPGTFWVGFLACALVMLTADTMRAAGPPRLPDVEGNWDGFFLAADGTTGAVTSQIGDQDSRRLAGDGVLDLGSRDVTYQYQATLARPDFLTGTGVTVTPAGRLVFQAGLATYAPRPPLVPFQTTPDPRPGDAGAMNPEFLFVPSHGGSNRVSAMLLHPFGGTPPDITGNYDGPCVSVAGPTFKGTGTTRITRNDRGYFEGHVDLFLDQDPTPFISWPFLATASANNRVLWVAQQKGGSFIYDGTFIPATNQTAARIDGILRLTLSGSLPLYNAYNSFLTSPVIR